jgi:flotillin
MALVIPTLALLLIAGIAAVALLIVIKNVLYVAQPNEVLVLSGWYSSTTSAGKSVGYRFLKGGRAFRVPLFETVDRMDLTNIIIDLQVRQAYSKGGIPLTVQGVANIKIPGEEPLIHNALERFLGKSRAEIIEIARETLEGNLRGVLATLTPEQVNQDKEAFGARLTEEAEHDLSTIGLVLDTLKIQNVTDDVGYLDAIGRMRSAEVRRNAQIAEARAKAEAAEQKWRNTMEAELSKLDAGMEVASKDNDRRITDARTKGLAMVAEQEGQVHALIAQARAEISMQDARIEQVQFQLQADVIQPAEAQAERAVQDAKAQAAGLIEQGRATAGVLKNLATAYREGGASGREVLLMQKLVPMLNQVMSANGALRVDRLTIVGGGASGSSGSLASSLLQASEQIKAATGVDLPAALKDRLGAKDSPKIPRTVAPPRPAE